MHANNAERKTTNSARVYMTLHATNATAPLKRRCNLLKTALLILSKPHGNKPPSTTIGHRHSETYVRSATPAINLPVGGEECHRQRHTVMSLPKYATVAFVVHTRRGHGGGLSGDGERMAAGNPRQGPPASHREVARRFVQRHHAATYDDALWRAEYGEEAGE
jgi:hypothetical protein